MADRTEAPAEARGDGIKVVRAAGSELRDAILLLDEYYAAVGVLQRDTQAAIRRFVSPELATPKFAQKDAAGMWIAYNGTMPAGCVVLRPLSALQSAGECKRLYVRPQFRRQGIAEALLDALEEFARRSSLEWIYLDSKDDLRTAIALYKRRGYEECGRYNENPQATIFLRKKIR